MLFAIAHTKQQPRGGLWELAGGFVGCPIDGRPKPLIGLELLLDIKSFIDPSQHALLKRLKDHIDINYVVPTDIVKSKKGEKETEVCTNKFFTVMKNLVVQIFHPLILLGLFMGVVHLTLCLVMEFYYIMEIRYIKVY